MATIYVSYKYEDTYIVNLLIPLLKEKGHRIRYDMELPIAATSERSTCNWRRFLSSDVVLVLWSQDTVRDLNSLPLRSIWPELRLS